MITRTEYHSAHAVLHGSIEVMEEAGYAVRQIVPFQNQGSTAGFLVVFERERN